MLAYLKNDYVFFILEQQCSKYMLSKCICFIKHYKNLNVCSKRFLNKMKSSNILLSKLSYVYLPITYFLMLIHILELKFMQNFIVF